MPQVRPSLLSQPGRGNQGVRGSSGAEGDVLKVGAGRGVGISSGTEMDWCRTVEFEGR